MDLISVCTELRGFDIGKAANVALWWSVVIETEQIIRLPTERQRHRHEHRPAIANDPSTVRGGGYIGVATYKQTHRYTQTEAQLQMILRPLSLLAIATPVIRTTETFDRMTS